MIGRGAIIQTIGKIYCSLLYANKKNTPFHYVRGGITTIFMPQIDKPHIDNIL